MEVITYYKINFKGNESGAQKRLPELCCDLTKEP